MANLPTPRERRTAKVVIYVTPGEHNNLRILAEIGGMSVSELGAQALAVMLDMNKRLGVISEKPVPQEDTII